MTDPNTPNDPSDQESLDDVLQGLSSQDSDEQQSLDDILASLSVDESEGEALDPSPLDTDSLLGDTPGATPAAEPEISVPQQTDPDPLTPTIDASTPPLDAESLSETVDVNAAAVDAEDISTNVEQWAVESTAEVTPSEAESSPFETPIIDSEAAVPPADNIDLPSFSTPIDTPETPFTDIPDAAAEAVDDPFAAAPEAVESISTPWSESPAEPAADESILETSATSEPPEVDLPAESTFEEPTLTDIPDSGVPDQVSSFIEEPIGMAPEPVESLSDTGFTAETPSAPPIPSETDESSPFAAPPVSSSPTADEMAAASPFEPPSEILEQPSEELVSDVEAPDLTDFAAPEPQAEDLVAEAATPDLDPGADITSTPSDTPFGEPPAAAWAASEPQLPQISEPEPFSTVPSPEEPVAPEVESPAAEAAAPIEEPVIEEPVIEEPVIEEPEAAAVPEQPIAESVVQPDTEPAEASSTFSGPELPDLPPLEPIAPSSISQASIDRPSSEPIAQDAEPLTLKTLLDRPRNRWMVPFGFILILVLFGAIILGALQGNKDSDPPPETQEQEQSSMPSRAGEGLS